MRSTIPLDDLRAGLKGASSGHRQVMLQRVHELWTELTRQEIEAPERVRKKITSFLDHLEASSVKHGERFLLPSFLLNSVAEAMARSDLVHGLAVEVVQVGLYFYGLEQIDRRWSRQAGIYSGIHAELLMESMGRKELKAILAEGKEKLDEGRVFCITYSYLNRLRKAYWAYCRASHDALDRAASEELVPEISTEAAQMPGIFPVDRVTLMLGVFRSVLTPKQQWIYLAKNREALFGQKAAPSSLEDLIADLEAPPPEGNLRWGEIALKLAVNEKTAKREYLRSLLLLLKHTGEAVFGESWVPQGVVRRVLQQIQLVVDNKDLRIRQSTGRGLNTLVEKWEVALRFVLSHDRVPA